jgi:hypothetical protein
MIVYNLPTTIKPKQVSYRAVSKNSLNKSNFTGHEVIYHYPDKHFEILVEYPRMNQATARQFEAVFMGMNNKTDVLKFFPSTNIQGVYGVGEFVSNNGSLYQVVNSTGAGDGFVADYNGSASHLFPAKKANWSDADIKVGSNVFVYCSITNDFEWDYDLATTTGISIPLREFIQVGTQTVESFDNIYELTAFKGYYYYGDDGSNGLGYYFPLFIDEAQSDAYTGGNGSSHLHTFATSPNISFYMPDGLGAGAFGEGVASIADSYSKYLTRHYFSQDIVEYGQVNESNLPGGNIWRWKAFPTRLSTDDINAPIGGGY